MFPSIRHVVSNVEHQVEKLNSNPSEKNVFTDMSSECAVLVIGKATKSQHSLEHIQDSKTWTQNLKNQQKK